MSLSSSSSILERFDFLCTHYGDYDAIVPVDAASNVGCCFTELQYASHLLASQLLYRYGRPDIVMLDVGGNAPAAELVSILACIRLQSLFCPVDVQRDPLRFPSMVKVLRNSKQSPRIAAIVLADTDTDPRVLSFFHVGIHFCLLVTATGDLVEPMTVPSALQSPPPCRNHHDDDDMYILFTSGTTSTEPRAVVGSHSHTVRRLQWFVELTTNSNLGMRRTPPRIARRTPLVFVDGVHEILSVLFHSEPPAQLVYSSQGGLLRDLVQHATHLTVLPSQLAQILSGIPQNTTSDDDTIAAHHGASPLQVIVVSGEPCPATVVEQYIAKSAYFQTTTRLYNFYGQTETVGDVCYANLLETPIVDGIVPVGRPLPGVVLEITETSEVIVRSGSLANGYYGNDNRSSFTLFRTGDIGFYGGDNCLYIRGRINDVQKVNGILTSPTEIETRFQQTHDGIGGACAAFIVNGTSYVLVEANDDIDSSSLFNREQMHRQGVPWNLVPQRVFFICYPLPRTTTGKVQRSAVQKIVQKLLVAGQTMTPGSTWTQVRDPLVFAVSSVLGLTPKHVQEKSSSSFVELGGDSHRAVSLWHLLSGTKEMATLCPADLLWATSIDDMGTLFEQGRGGKRIKRNSVVQQHQQTNEASPLFIPSPLQWVKQNHYCMKFPGCVDARPILHNGCIYGACQTGVLQCTPVDRTSGNDANVQSLSLEDHWRVQASLVPHDNGIIVCCHHALDKSGLVLSVSTKLDEIQWQVSMVAPIEATPCVSGSFVFVHYGDRLCMLDITTGRTVGECRLKGISECQPTLLNMSELAIELLYVYSDWDCGGEIVSFREGILSVKASIDGLNAPIRADPLLLGHYRVVAVDVTGCVHDIDTRTLTVKTAKIASVPLQGAPGLTSEGNVVVGCNDGFLRCLSEQDLSVVLWSVKVGAVVRSRAIATHTNQMVVCTTAGDVVSVSHTNRAEPVTSKIASAEGEIWSNPLLVVETLTDQCPSTSKAVAFGARDSRLHIFRL